METSELLLLAGTGIFAGMINVLAGGGSLLTMPVMIFLGLPGPIANGTNRVAILLQNLTAFLSFWKQGFREIRLSITLGLAALPGAAAGAFLGTKLTGVWFNRVLAFVMLGVLVLMVTGKKKGETEVVKITRQRLILAHILIVFAGMYGGFIQAGTGFILMFILHRVLGRELAEVNRHKVTIVMIYTVIALAVFISKGQVVWVAGLALAAGNSLGGWIGSHMNLKGGDRLIRPVLYMALVAMAGKLLYDSV